MIRIINLKSKKAIREIKRFQNRLKSQIDIKFENVHLRRLNAFFHYELFKKNDLFMNSTTLWELMQKSGKIGSHNYHGLPAERIYDAISNLENPICVFKAKAGRYAIIPVASDIEGKFLMAIIEIGSGLTDNKDANVNKLITLYPKANLERIIERMDPKDVLYKK